MILFLKLENNETLIKSLEFDGQQEVPSATQQHKKNKILINPSNLTIKSSIFEPEFTQTLNLVENDDNSTTVKYIKKFQMMKIVEPPISIENYRCNLPGNVNLTHFITNQNLPIPVLHSIGSIKKLDIPQPKIRNIYTNKPSTPKNQSTNSIDQNNLNILNEKITNLENSCSKLENKIIIPKNFDTNVEKIAQSITLLTKSLEKQQQMINLDQSKIEKLLKLDSRVLDKIIKLSDDPDFMSNQQKCSKIYQSTPNQTLNSNPTNILPNIPPPPPINMSISPIPRPPPLNVLKMETPPVPPVPIPRSISYKNINEMGESATPKPISMSNVFEQIKNGKFNLKRCEKKKEILQKEGGCSSMTNINVRRKSCSLPQRTHSLTLSGMSSPIIELKDALSRRRSIILPSSSDDDMLEDDDVWE